MDRSSLLRHGNNRSVWRNLRDIFPHPYTGAHADAWLARVGEGSPIDGTYAIDVDGEAVGSISVVRGGDIEWMSAELGYWLGEPYWGRGITSEAVGMITDAAFGEQDIVRLWATAFAWNSPSMRVLEKNGFRREGILRQSAVKDGVLIDRVLYARTANRQLPYVAAP